MEYAGQVCPKPLELPLKLKSADRLCLLSEDQDRRKSWHPGIWAWSTFSWLLVAVVREAWAWI